MVIVINKVLDLTKGSKNVFHCACWFCMCLWYRKLKRSWLRKGSNKVTLWRHFCSIVS